MGKLNLIFKVVTGLTKKAKPLEKEVPEIVKEVEKTLEGFSHRQPEMIDDIIRYKTLREPKSKLGPNRAEAVERLLEKSPSELTQADLVDLKLLRPEDQERLSKVSGKVIVVEPKAKPIKVPKNHEEDFDMLMEEWFKDLKDRVRNK